MSLFLSWLFLYGQKFTQFLPGTLKSLSFYAGVTAHVRIALYSDGGNNPANPLTSVYTVFASAGLNTVSMKQEDQILLNATNYWIVFDFDTDGGVCFSSIRNQTFDYTTPTRGIENLIRNFISGWVYGTDFPSTWSGGNCDNGYEAEVYWTATVTSAHPLSYYTLSYFTTPTLQANDSYIEWYASDYVWNNVLNATTRDSVRRYMNVYAQEAFKYMGFDFTGNHYLANYTSPLGNKIAVWIQEEIALVGGFCSSGHDGYRPYWAHEDTPLIGIGVLSFNYKGGGSEWWGSTVLAHGENLYGYYAYDVISHEFMNMFNFFACVNVPSWIADGHSPYAFTISKIIMIQTGTAIGGTLGEALIDLANRELNYGLGSDTGVQFFYILQHIFPNAVSSAYQGFRNDKVAFGWTEYGNATGGYPIITETALRSAYFEVYYNLAANVTDLPWSFITYIPMEENNPALRATLENILFKMRSTNKMLTDYKNDGHDIIALSVTMQTAWMDWRKGYYTTAYTTILPIYNQLIGLGYQPSPPLQTCLTFPTTTKDLYDNFLANYTNLLAKLTVIIETGTLYFPTEEAVIWVLTDGGNGKPTNTTLTGAIILPNGTVKNLAFTWVSTGLYKAVYTVDLLTGTYLVKAEANLGTLYGSSIKSFLVSGTLVGNLVGLKDDIATIKTDLGIVKLNLTTLHAAVTTISGNVVTIMTDVGTIKVDVAAIKPVITKIEGDVALISTALGDLEVKLDAINATLVSIEGDIATIKTDLGTVRADVATIKPTVVSIAGEVATIKTDVGTIKGTVVTIQGDVATIKTDVGTIKVSVSGVKSSVDAMNTPLYAAVILALIAAIASVVCVIQISRKIAG